MGSGERRRRISIRRDPRTIGRLGPRSLSGLLPFQVATLGRGRRPKHRVDKQAIPFPEEQGRESGTGSRALAHQRKDCLNRPRSGTPSAARKSAPAPIGLRGIASRPACRRAVLPRPGPVAAVSGSTPRTPTAPLLPPLAATGASCRSSPPGGSGDPVELPSKPRLFHRRFPSADLHRRAPSRDALLHLEIQ